MAQHLGATLALILSATGAQAAPVCMQALLQGSEGSLALTVEIAADPASRATGLMHRDHMPLNHGMLFLFDAPGRRSFWMENTRIPLDVVPLDADGTVLEVLEGVPYSRDALTPAQPVQRILEVNAGIVATMGALPGGRFVLLGGVDCATGLLDPFAAPLASSPPSP